MTSPARIQVLLPQTEAARFDAYCQRQGFKKSTLIARLVREHLDKEDDDIPANGVSIKQKKSRGAR